MRMRTKEIRQMFAAGRIGLDARQRTTLDIGCWLVLGTVALGLDVGGWSAWSVVAAALGYLVWVLAYAEATVQATRRQRRG